MSVFLRLAARPRLLLSCTVLMLVAAVLLGGGLADRLKLGGTEDPAAESSLAAEVMDAKFPQSRPNLVLLVEGEGGADDPRTAAQAGALTKKLAAEDGVTGVVSYWLTKDPALRSKNGEQALIVGHIKGDETKAGDVFERIEDDYRGHIGDLDLSIGGTVAVRNESQQQTAEDLVRSEMIALPIVLIILLLAFGSVVAALLPLAIGIVAILGTNAVLRGITEFTDVSIFAMNLTTALGFGLAIDYALLIVRRYREELDKGREPAEALPLVLRTAGRTVLFSAFVVAVSLSAMLIFPLYFLRSFAYAGISVVLLAALAALTVLPALLLLLGHRVNALRVIRGGREEQAERRWRSFTSGVMRRGPVVTIGVTALLVVLGLPFLKVEFGTVDDRQLSASAEPRAVHDTIRETFTGSPTGGIDVLARTEPGKPVDGYAAKLSTVANVARVDSPTGTYREGRLLAPPTQAHAARHVLGTSHLTVWPAPDVEDISLESQDLVRDVRTVDAPFEAKVGGQAAMLVDSQRSIGDRLPYGLAFIVVVTMLMVFLMSGSVVLPLLAVILNALSLTAMFGAAVWVFQEGNLSGPLGFTATGFIETSLPVLMFCLAFGLSMDYSLFLLSRMKEKYDQSGDHREAVVFAVSRTGGVITAAALILAIVMIAIGTSQITLTKMLGLGVALAVLVDATLVRCLLVPALMAVTGKATWWAPAALKRFQERFGISEEGPATAAGVPRPGGAGDEDRVGGGTGGRGGPGSAGKETAGA
ncbi:MMPL family transporter [Streptomyces sp. NA04227]|uniref:MMPL family transporter n=1 Tax=Streptomyces sp. NA04227 TaxID=2742136 RepID=UPI0015926155|nr:MMPL family transporter [Streptomyces sp. NA04227]QKW09058.1 MMPL family transporter [Streptomyces sp. NA04227]